MLMYIMKTKCFGPKQLNEYKNTSFFKRIILPILLSKKSPRTTKFHFSCSVQTNLNKIPTKGG